jgi:hypothetical protein
VNKQNKFAALTLLCLLVFSPNISTSANSKQTFRIERVYVFAQYDSAFVLAVAHAVLRPDRDLSESQVDCLLATLRASGLFERVQTEWSYPESGIRRLTLHCYTRPGRKRFIVSRISLVDLPEVDSKLFLKHLADKGLKPGVTLLQFPYDEMNEIVDESIRSAVPKERISKYQGSAWISFKQTSKGRIEIRAFASEPNCQ